MSIAASNASPEQSFADMSRHPLKTVSTQQLEEAIAKALAELVPTPGYDYRVSMAAVEFGVEQLTRGPAKLTMTVWNSRPIGDLLGGDIFGGEAEG